MIGRLLRCCSIIRHRRRRSCLHTGNCFIYTLLFFIIQHTTHLFVFIVLPFFSVLVHVPCPFQASSCFSLFLTPIRLGSARISQSTFRIIYTLSNTCNSRRLRPSTSILSASKYLELLDLFLRLRVDDIPFSMLLYL